MTTAPSCSPGGCCGPPRKRHPTIRELDDFDAAEADRTLVIRGRDARRLRAVDGTGPPAPPPDAPRCESCGRVGPVVHTPAGEACQSCLARLLRNRGGAL